MWTFENTRNQGHHDTQTIDLIGEALYLLRDHLQDIQNAIVDENMNADE